MQKSIGGNYKLIGQKSNVKDMILSNYKLIIIFMIFVIGVVYALLSFKSVNSGTSALCTLLKQQYEIKATQTFMDCFLNYISSYAVYFVVVLLSGLCAVGLPTLLLVPFTYGVSLGYQITYLYTQYQVKGVGYTALIIAPIALIFGAVLLFAVCEGINMSWDILGAVQDGKRTKIKMNTYFKRFAIYAVAIIVDTVIFSFINVGISKIIVL